MKKQKILSFILVVAMMLTMSATVFAVDPITTTTTGETTIEVHSRLEVPTYSVTINPPEGIIVNPYQMSVNIPGVTPIATSTNTVITTPNLITNSSNIGVKVTATPTASVAEGSTVLISTADITSIAGKAIKMTMYMANSSASTISDYAGTDDATGTTTYSNTKSAILTKKTATDKNSCSIALAAKDASGDKYGVYLIKGDAKPSDDNVDKWNSGLDEIDIHLVFDIQADYT